ncbi:MAG: ABC transporter ATP-binding protein [Pseudomonadota bacterium]
MAAIPEHEFKVTQIFALIAKILGPERSFYWLALVYGVGISLLSLATPISVQMLINTVANTAMAAPLIVLSATLFVLLLASGLLNALRIHLMEIFGRRFYARLVAEIGMRAIYARNPFFNDDGRGPLFNRYFDIIIIQKNIPGLLVGGFTLILQAGVGFILVSFYHPLFLAMNAVIIAALWAIWLIWGKRAIRTAIDLSHSKHEVAAWLEGLAASNGFFKTQRHVAYAFDQTDAQTANYVNVHKKHFRQHFSQTIALLILYALASAVLLGLGGWLVIQGQLSLGQLVAAELVLSAVFFGLSQLSPYMIYFYDLCAAVEELSRFLSIELEDAPHRDEFDCVDSSLAFVDVTGEARGKPAQLDFKIPSGATTLAASSRHGVQRLVTHLLKRVEEPDTGYIALGNADIKAAGTNQLHQNIVVLDRPTVIEMTIREYLSLCCDDVGPARMLEVLTVVGLDRVISRSKKGLDTYISANGWPLSITETMLLKLAAAILSRPRVLVLNQLYDLANEQVMRRALGYLQADKSNTVIYFSRRQHDVGCDTFLYLHDDGQSVFTSFNEFKRVAYPEEPTTPPGDKDKTTPQIAIVKDV